MPAPLPAPPRTGLGASPLDETRLTSVHTAVNKVVTEFVTILSSYAKLPSLSEEMGAKVMLLLCVQERYAYLRCLGVLSV